jgi:hypothetical protein
MTDEDAQVTEEEKWDKEYEEWKRDQANIEHVEGKAAQVNNYKDKAEYDNVVKFSSEAENHDDTFNDNDMYHHHHHHHHSCVLTFDVVIQ